MNEVWRYQIGLKFAQVDVEGAVEPERGRDRGDDLRDQAIQVCVRRHRQVQVLHAQLVDGLPMQIGVTTWTVTRNGYVILWKQYLVTWVCLFTCTVLSSNMEVVNRENCKFELLIGQYIEASLKLVKLGSTIFEKPFITQTVKTFGAFKRHNRCIINVLPNSFNMIISRTMPSREWETFCNADASFSIHLPDCPPGTPHQRVPVSNGSGE